MHILELTITSTALITVYSDSLITVLLCGFLLHFSLGYMWNTNHNYGKKLHLSPIVTLQMRNGDRKISQITNTFSLLTPHKVSWSGPLVFITHMVAVNIVAHSPNFHHLSSLRLSNVQSSAVESIQLDKKAYKLTNFDVGSIVVGVQTKSL